MQVNDPYQNQNRKNMLWLGGGVGLLLIVSILGFTAGFLKMFGQGGGSPVRVQGTAPEPPPLLDAGSVPETMTREDAKSMPKDVYDWLKHLERIERERRRMATAQAAELSVAMTKMSLGGATEMLKGLMSGEEPGGEEPPLPTDDLVKSTEAKRQDWAKLIEDYRSFPPPAECGPAAAAYDEALTETRAMMMEVLESMALAQEDPDKAIAALTSLQGTSTERIDVAGKDTDREVQAICDKYETRKWFGISSDFAGGLMGGIPSMPGR